MNPSSVVFGNKRKRKIWIELKRTNSSSTYGDKCLNYKLSIIHTNPIIHK